MAKFMDAPGLMRIDESTLKLREEPELMDIDLGVNKDTGFDFNRELEQMSAKGLNRGTESPGGLQLSEIDIDIASLATADSFEKLLPAEEKYLQKIKQFISEEKFDNALEVIGKFLAECPGHHEGIYLAALCHEHLSEHELSLERLFQLREANTSQKLAGRIDSLKEKLRNHFKIDFLVQSLVMQPQDIIAEIEKITSLDPDYDFYYFLWCTHLMRAQRTLQAYECLELGLCYVTGSGKEELLRMQEQVEDKLVEDLLQPVAVLYKAGNYKNGRKVIAGFDVKFRGKWECILFDSYLKQLAGGLFGFIGKQRRLETVEIQGEFSKAERLQTIILRKEIKEAQICLEQEDLVGARKVLFRALTWFPLYPYANFLLAGCTYKLISLQFFHGDFDNIELMITELEVARIQAQQALQDPAISAGRDLLSQIEVALAIFTKIREELAARRREVEEINGAIGEFVDIMQNADKGISSVEMFEGILARMKALDKRVKELWPQLRNPDGKKTLSDLATALQRNLSTLRDMEKTVAEQKKDADVVHEAQGKFKAIMDSSQGGIGSEKQADDLRRRLTALKKELVAYTRKVGSKEAKEALAQLGQTVDQSVKQLEEVKISIRDTGKDVEIVNRISKDFGAVMSDINSGKGITSLYQAEEALRSLSQVLSACFEGLKQVKTPPAKEALQNLVKNVTNIHSQISKAIGRN